MGTETSIGKIAWFSKYDVEKQQIETAIGYLPSSLREEWPKQEVAIITMHSRLGLRLSKSLREEKEIVFLSERVFPRNGGLFEKDPVYKHFIFVLLHELAHIFLDHPQTIMEEEKDEYERAADNKAKEWYDEHAREIGLPELDLEEMQQINGYIDREFDHAVRMARRKMSPPVQASGCDDD